MISSFVLTSSDPESLTRAFFIIFLARSAASRSRSKLQLMLEDFPSAYLHRLCNPLSYTHLRVHICTHTHTHLRVHICTHTHLRAHIRTRTCIRTQALPHTQMLSDGACYIGEKSLQAHFMTITKNIISLLAQRTVLGASWHTWAVTVNLSCIPVDTGVFS